ncbi:hypothetical protein M422DRAFT_42990 [Sphaerobolus stellatus SS14]|nr:hypothetical protein M422DRAFT_42990 [Sphaerobolus stellatus SS14]
MASPELARLQEPFAVDVSRPKVGSYYAQFAHDVMRHQIPQLPGDEYPNIFFWEDEKLWQTSEFAYENYASEYALQAAQARPSTYSAPVPTVPQSMRTGTTRHGGSGFYFTPTTTTIMSRSEGAEEEEEEQDPLKVHIPTESIRYDYICHTMKCYSYKIVLSLVQKFRSQHQNFQMLFDTGGSTTRGVLKGRRRAQIPGQHISLEAVNNIPVPRGNAYDPNHNFGNHNLGRGCLVQYMDEGIADSEGQYWQDQVQLLCVRGELSPAFLLEFGVITLATANLLESGEDGIIGLSYHETKYNPSKRQSHQNGLIFCVSLDDLTGMIIFGAPPEPTSPTPPLRWLPVVEKHSKWHLSLYCIELWLDEDTNSPKFHKYLSNTLLKADAKRPNNTAESSPPIALIDSGTALLWLPRHVNEGILEGIGFRRHPLEGYYLPRGEIVKGVTIRFKFRGKYSGVNIWMPTVDIVRKDTKPILANIAGSKAILGMPFFKALDIYFDASTPPRIAFRKRANPKEDNSGWKVVETASRE